MSEGIGVRLDFRDPLLPEGLSLAVIETVIEARTLAEIPAALAALEAYWDAGATAVGFIAYEAAAAFEPSLTTLAPSGDLPLLWFAIGEPATPPPLPTGKAGALDLAPNWDEATYCATVDRVLQAIHDGETYQLNLSFPFTGTFEGGDVDALYGSLMRAQRSAYGAHLRTPQWQILSVSPELFFRLEDGCLESRPMKGTRARGKTTAEDALITAELRQNAKERAENVMIVDLLRNDIGRLAEPGSVSVPALFELEQYPTVWQMTSQVRGRLQAGKGLDEILAALFPCGSVTGAPKRKTMEWIARQETAARGVYCGAIGALLPKRQAIFSVPIRTLTLGADGECRYPVGSGVVADAEPAAEYRECLAKAAVLQRASLPEFYLLETMRWDPDSGYALLDEHLARLGDSAVYFGWDFDLGVARQQLLAGKWSGSMRIRLLLADDGTLEMQAVPLAAPTAKTVALALAKAAVASDDLFLYHKTTHRLVYEPARRQLADSAADDVLLYNERGELTETTIGNLALRFGDNWYTPPVNCGLLAGTQRTVELRQGRVQERVMHLDELETADEIAVMNSVRGWQQASLLR